MICYFHIFSTTAAIAGGGSVVVEELPSYQHVTIRKIPLDSHPRPSSKLQEVQVVPNERGVYALNLDRSFFSNPLAHLLLKDGETVLGNALWREGNLSFFAKRFDFAFTTALEAHNLYVQTEGAFTFESPVKVGGNAHIKTQKIALLSKWMSGGDSTFESEEGFLSQGRITSQNLTVQTVGELVCKVLASAGETLSLSSAKGLVDVEDGLSAGMYMTVNGHSMKTNGPIKVRQGDIVLDAQELLDMSGQLHAREEVSLKAGGSIVQKGSITVGKKLLVETPIFEDSVDARVKNKGSTILRQGRYTVLGNWHLMGALLFEDLSRFIQKGLVKGEGPLLGQVDHFQNMGSMTIGGLIRLGVQTLFKNENLLTAEDHFVLMGEEGFQNRGSMVLHKRGVFGSAEERSVLFMNAGEMTVKGPLQVFTKRLGNTGTLKGEEILYLDVEDILDNKSTIEAKQILQVKARRINNYPKGILNASNLFTEAEILESGGEILFEELFSFKGATLKNRGDIIGSEGSMVFEGTIFDNYGFLRGKAGQFIEFDTVHNRERASLDFYDTLVLKGKEFKNYRRGARQASLKTGFLNMGVYSLFDGGVTDIALVALIQANSGEFRGQFSCGWGSINTNYSLQIPSEATFDVLKSLTFNAQASLMFDGKVSLRERNLKREKELYARLEDNPALVALTRKMPNEIMMIGNTSFRHGGKVISAYTPVHYRSNRGKVTCSHTSKTQSGYFDTNSTTIHALEAALEGELTSFGHISVRTEGKLDFGGATQSKTLGVSTGAGLHVSGEHQVETSASFEAKGLIEAAVGSSVRAGESLSMKGSSIDHRGDLTAESVLVLSADEDIRTYYLSTLSGKQTQIKTGDTFKHQGSIETDYLSARAHYLTNHGYISAKSAQLNADRIFFNGWGGIIDTENLTINAGMSINFLGLMHARNSMTINSLVDLNFLGVRASHNLQTNTLFSLNAGLNTFSLPTWDYFTSRQNLLGGGLALLRMIDPTGLARVANFAYSGYNLVHQIGDIIDRLNQGGFEDYGLSDWVGAGMHLKGTAMSIKGIYSSGSTLFDKREDMSTLWDRVTGDHWSTKLASMAADTFGGKISNDSLFGAHLGASLSGTVYERNLFGIDSGFVGAYGGYTVEHAYDGTGAGYSVAPVVNISARNYDFRGTARTSSFNLRTTQDQHIRGRVHTNKASLRGRNGSLAGSLWAHEVTGDFSGGRFTLDGGLYSDQATVKARYGDLRGTVQSDQFYGDFDEVDMRGKYAGYQRSDGKRTFVVKAKRGHLGGTLRGEGYAFEIDGHTVVDHILDGVHNYGLKAGSADLGGLYRNSRNLGIHIKGHADVSHTLDGVENMQLNAGSGNLGGIYRNSRGLNFDMGEGGVVSFQSGGVEGLRIRGHSLDFLNSERMQGRGFEIDADVYRGGVEGFVGLMEHLGADQVTGHARGYDYKILKGFSFSKSRHLHFRNVENHVELDMEGGLVLEAENDFITHKSIRAKGGLSTIARKGRNVTDSGAVLESTEGQLYVHGRKGVDLESAMTLHNGKKYLKVAGFRASQGIGVYSGADFNMHAANLNAGNGVLDFNIAGNINDRAFQVDRGTVAGVIGANGQMAQTPGHARAGLGYMTSQYSGDIIQGFVGGSFNSEAGQFSFARGGRIQAQKGFHFGGFAHTYVVESGSESKGPFGIWGEHTWSKEDTDFYVSRFISGEGGFDLITPESGVTFEGTQFLTKGTNRIFARDSVHLGALKSTEHQRDMDSSWLHLRRKRDNSDQEVAAVTTMVGLDKLFIHSREGKITGEGAQIYAKNGGGIYGEKGVDLRHLELSSHYDKSDKGLDVDYVGRDGLQTIHPIGSAIDGLINPQDGVTGLLTDFADVSMQSLNVLSNLTKTLMSGGGLLGVADMMKGELGLTRVGVGLTFVDEHGNRRAAQMGDIRADGTFEIGAGKGQTVDLRGNHLDMGGVTWDVDRILMGGAREHYEEHRSETRLGGTFDALGAVTDESLTAGLGAYFSTSKTDEVGETSKQAKINIGSMHFKRRAEVTLEDGLASIGSTTGEKYTIRVVDNQDVIRRSGHHFGISTSLREMAGEAAGTLTRSQTGSIGFGFHDTTEYKTAHRSQWRVGRGTNMDAYEEVRHEDRIEGGGFGISYAPSLEGDVFSAPITVSGQIGGNRFRVKPYARFNPENLPMYGRTPHMKAEEDHHHEHPEEKHEDHDDIDFPPTGGVPFMDMKDEREKTVQEILESYAPSLFNSEDNKAAFLGMGLLAAIPAAETLLAGGGLALAGGGAIATAPVWVPAAAAAGVGAYLLYNARDGGGHKGSSNKRESKRYNRELRDPTERPHDIRVTPNQRLRNKDIAKDNTIDLERFSVGGKKGVLRDPKSGYEIRPDRARSSGAGGHGGSHWKLFKDGRRIATLDDFGRILRMDK